MGLRPMPRERRSTTTGHSTLIRRGAGLKGRDISRLSLPEQIKKLTDVLKNEHGHGKIAEARKQGLARRIAELKALLKGKRIPRRKGA